MNPILLCVFAVIIMSFIWIVGFQRINKVHDFRSKLIKKCRETAQREINWWYNRTDLLHEEIMYHKPDFSRFFDWYDSLPSFDNMTLKFWKPLDSFVDGYPFPTSEAPANKLISKEIAS